MELNEIKKSLYKENPKAKLVSINQHSLLYGTELEINQVVSFIVPLSDIGDAKFYPEMEAKLLIRYIN